MSEGPPKSIRELLAEMKNTSDRMVDLSLASIYFDDERLAKLVQSLESKMDDLTYSFFHGSAMVSRSREEAKRMVGLMQIAASAENISNACGDLASLVLRKVEIHPVLKDALASASERLAKVKVRENSKLAGKRLGDLRLPSSMGVWVLARGREGEYTVPGKETILEAGDLLVAKGPAESFKRLYVLAGESPPSPSKPLSRLRGVRKTLAEMRDAAVLSVDLAYSAVLLNLREPAELVREIEKKFDMLSHKLWSETLRLVRKGKEGLESILETVRCLERITDSADSIVDFMLRGIEPHPVLTEVMCETDEKICRIQVKPGSILENRSVGELDLWTTAGSYILFIQRGDRFIYTPSRKTRIQAGDFLVIRGAYAGIEKIMKLAEVSVSES